MDQKFDVHWVEEEEENSGWTILRAAHDEQLDEIKAQGTDPDSDKDSAGSGRVSDGFTHGTEEKSNEEDERSDDAEEFLYSEADDDADDDLTDYGVDEGGEDMGSPFSDSPARAYVWEDSVGEALGKQTLVEQHPDRKQGLIWRISLVATLGLFGWAVLSGFGGGWKNFRSVKIHPCSLKEGEPVLGSM